MAVNISRGAPDDVQTAIADALAVYVQEHPRAHIDLCRQSRFSIRVRVVDPDFVDLSRADRNDLVWRSLARLPEDVQSDITMLVLLTPEEMATSGANLEFEHPVPQVLL
jgi:hypothetical protein